MFPSGKVRRFRAWSALKYKKWMAVISAHVQNDRRWACKNLTVAAHEAMTSSGIALYSTEAKYWNMTS
jgi:hypothetical protein